MCLAGDVRDIEKTGRIDNTLGVASTPGSRVCGELICNVPASSQGYVGKPYSSWAEWAMSSPSEVADAWYDTLFFNYCATAAAVFMLYDYTICTGRELRSFWRRPIKAASILFFSNKYITVTKHILDWLIPLGTSDKSCTLLSNTTFVVELLQLIPWGVFSALRALALSRSRILALLVLALSVIPMGVNFYLFRYGLDGKVVPYLGCQMHQRIPVPRPVFFQLTSISRSSFILADLLLILITWFTLSRRHLSHPGARSQLSRILLLDGTIYFILLFIMNVLQITFTFLSIFGTGGASGMSAFTEPVTSVLVARFLLDLQEASQRQHPALSTGPEGSSTRSDGTTTFMGSLDSTIMFGFSENSDSGTELDVLDGDAVVKVKNDEEQPPEAPVTRLGIV